MRGRSATRRLAASIAARGRTLLSTMFVAWVVIVTGVYRRGMVPRRNAEPALHRIQDKKISVRQMPFRSRNDRARYGCLRENHALQRSGAVHQAYPGFRTS